MAEEYIIHPQSLPPDRSGLLIDLPREHAGWEWMSFFVRRLSPGDQYRAGSATEETVHILMGGRCRADWGEGWREIGERTNVFDGLPYALYLPSGSDASLEAITTCEFAECRVPSTAMHSPRLVTPDDAQVSLRGGGNASRQIVDVIPPSFPADRIIAVEVYTPAGNWSSFPPHKHDVHNPPAEVDLDEIYYYRMQRPEGYAHQRLYRADGSRDLVVTPHDGDCVLIRDGYHPVVAGHGYNCYYLNFIAGSARSLANTVDPQHAWVMQTWKEISPGLPMVQRAKAGKQE